jgi:dTDP-4-amino-4,6-dideoxygalactose transaminase
VPALAILGGTPVRTTPFPAYPVRGEDEVAAAAEVIRAGNLSGQGEGQVAAFAAEFAAYSGVRFGVATSNGTTALHTALGAAGVGVGDEVIVPPYTFLSTATSPLMQNAIPVFADIESQTLGLDPRAVAARITPRTKAVIVVHMNGYPADLDGLDALARERGLTLIEDCSHAHGAEHRGRKVGTIGRLGVFSFQQRKNLSLGEGGIVITDDEQLAARAAAFVSFGPVPLAYNYRMTEIHGAIGRVRLRRLDEQNAERIRNARFLDRELEGVPGLRPQRPRPDTKVVYYNYVLHYDESALGVSRRRFTEAVAAEGVPVPAIYRPLHRHHTFRTRDAYGHGYPWAAPAYGVPEAEQPRYEDGICPVAEESCDRRNIELKIHPPATIDDMADIAAALKKVMAHLDDLRQRDETAVSLAAAR